MTTATAPGLNELVQPPALAAHIWGFLRRAWGVLEGQRHREGTPVIAGNLRAQQPKIELESLPIAQWSPQTESDLRCRRGTAVPHLLPPDPYRLWRGRSASHQPG